MTRTPDEIKKGLECCNEICNSESCPYWKDSECNISARNDALAYISQLESQNRCFKEIKESCEKRMIDMAQRMPSWISVEERLPEHDVFVLVGYNRYDLVFEGCYLEDEKYWCDREYSYIAPPSHWMPLPEPPKEE